MQIARPRVDCSGPFLTTAAIYIYRPERSYLDTSHGNQPNTESKKKGGMPLRWSLFPAKRRVTGVDRSEVPSLDDLQPSKCKPCCAAR
jgi:hypothetical protein